MIATKNGREYNGQRKQKVLELAGIADFNEFDKIDSFLWQFCKRNAVRPGQLRWR